MFSGDEHEKSLLPWDLVSDFPITQCNRKGYIRTHHLTFTRSLYTPLGFSAIFSSYLESHINTKALIDYFGVINIESKNLVHGSCSMLQVTNSHSRQSHLQPSC